MQEEIKEILYMLKSVIDNPEETFCANATTCYLLLDYITNLQEENEYFNHCDEEKRKTITNLRYKIEKLEEDNKQLKELCDKYEEEHKTTFEEWKKDINIIDELEKWLKEQIFNKAGSSVDLAIENHSYCKVLDKLNELKEK